ncbi:MAG: hypothetical protein M3486_10705 [Actinomycetota bacterium]|nr:hypothetical protein [Actinomycetota bacterium]
MTFFRRLVSPQHTTTARRCPALLACTAVVLTGALVQQPSAMAAPAPAPARDLFLQPFAAASVWNLPIGTGASFESASDPKTANLLNTGGVWANHSTWSHPVDRARDSDPLATVSDRYDSRRSAVYRVPVNARIAAGGDQHMHVVTPDGLAVHETWSAERLSTTQYRVGRHEEVDLRGSGIGPSNGTRAYGGSAIGGLIRSWEVDPTHPSYTGVIRHPIAVALRDDQLLYTGGTHGYDSAGYGTARGYAWPATEQDSNSPTAYAGKIPMGTYLAIPPRVDVAALGLTPQGLMLARAYQDYGGYATDRSGETTLAYVEPSAAGSAFAKALLGSDYAATDLKRIRAQLRVVTNNSPSTPNGAPLGGARRATLLP